MELVLLLGPFASLPHSRGRGLYQVKLYHARQRSPEVALVSHTAAAGPEFPGSRSPPSGILLA